MNASGDPPTNDVDAAVECDCAGAFGFHWDGSPHFPAVLSWLPTLDLIRGQFSIGTTADHVEPSVKGRSSKGADSYSQRRHLQVEEEHPGTRPRHRRATASVSALSIVLDVDLSPR